MSAIRDGKIPIMLDDKERYLLFSLNAVDAVQDRFGDIAALPEKMSGKDNIKNLRWMLTLLMNEGRDENEPEFTEMQVGRMIHVGNLMSVKDAMFKAISVGNNSDYRCDDEDGKENMGDKGESMAGR